MMFTIDSFYFPIFVFSYNKNRVKLKLKKKRILNVIKRWQIEENADNDYLNNKRHAIRSNNHNKFPPFFIPFNLFHMNSETTDTL